MFMPSRAKLRQNDVNVVSWYSYFPLQLPVFTLSIKKVYYYCSIWLKDSPITTFQNVIILSEDSLKGEKSSELRLNGKHLEKNGGFVFLASFRKCIDTRSGTAQVLNIIIKRAKRFVLQK